MTTAASRRAPITVVARRDPVPVAPVAAFMTERL